VALAKKAPFNPTHVGFFFFLFFLVHERLARLVRVGQGAEQVAVADVSVDSYKSLKWTFLSEYYELEAQIET
jgi:hypothetical protein